MPQMKATPQLGTWRQRLLVRAADLCLAPIGWLPQRRQPIRRILVLRLERIGDLLMTLDALAQVRGAWPHAELDLAVGSWNASLARLVPGITTIHEVDVPWLSRGERPTSWSAIVRAARRWPDRNYDLVINFEPDIRSNFLAWLSGAPMRVGFSTGGGAPLLTRAIAFDPSCHVADNAQRLVRVAADDDGRRVGDIATVLRRLAPPASPRVDSRLAGLARPLVGVHVSGGRPSKQWHLDRFAEVARRLAAATGGSIVLTGSASDRTMTDEVAAALTGVPVVVLAGELDLPDTAAALSRLDVLVTGDTGPMHLAAAVDVPVVALFGPSDPARYGPRATQERILRADLPCSPCGLVRLPPVRCRGHVPDCMDAITSDRVVDAALTLLADRRPVMRTVTAS